MSRAVQALEAEGWVALARVHRPGGGRHLIDQLLIGPGGIVVVDSYAWVGRIEVTHGVVRQNGFWRESECAEVTRAAGSVAALLRPQHRTAVHAVICVAQHDLQHHLVAPGVHVVGVTGLARLLRSLPRRLHPAEIPQLHSDLRRVLADSAPPEQLTTADVDFPFSAGRRGCLLDVPTEVLPVVGPSLAVPVTARSCRSSVRVAARRRRPGRRPGRRGAGVDWWLFAVRLLLAALVALAVVLLGPEFVGRPSQTVPGHVGPFVPPSSPTGAPSSGPPAGPAADVVPAAATAREDVPSPRGAT